MRRRNPDGVHRAARATTCRRCRAHVFAGLDDDQCARAVVVDPAPLNAWGELAAVMAGRETFALAWVRGRYEINPRELRHIQSHPPGTDVNVDVVVRHECGTPPLPRTRSAIRKAERKTLPTEAPF